VPELEDTSSWAVNRMVLLHSNASISVSRHITTHLVWDVSKCLGKYFFQDILRKFFSTPCSIFGLLREPKREITVMKFNDSKGHANTIIS
jgi:hypothetical protein